MEVISFDISGKFAHFRKFHGNNTALTYSTPPRTTIAGLIAAMLGEERGQYHEPFRHPNLLLGVRVLTRVKKTIQRLNYLKVVSTGDFSGKNGRVQTPFEVVTPQNLRGGNVIYRIYVGQGADKELFERIKGTFDSKQSKFNLSLGPANFVASVTSWKSEYRVTKKSAGDDWINVHSACNSDSVTDIAFDPADSTNQIEEELMPADFVANLDREVYRMNRILISTTGNPLQVKLNAPYYELHTDGNNTENIQFLEYARLLAQPKG